MGCDTQSVTDRRTDGQTGGQTDEQTDIGQSDPYVSLCFAGDTKTLVFFEIQSYLRFIRSLSHP